MLQIIPNIFKIISLDNKIIIQNCAINVFRKVSFSDISLIFDDSELEDKFKNIKKAKY